MSRAGGTVWELAAAGLPALLVPYPHATGDHQRANAEYFAAAGGAVIVDDAALDGARLRARVAELRASRGGSRGCAPDAQLRGPTRPRPSPASCCASRGERPVSAEVHLLGIGGAGMSGIARVLRGHGRRVSGCDRSPRPLRSCAPRASMLPRARPGAPAAGHGGDRLERRGRATSPSSSRRAAGPARAPPRGRAGRHRGVGDGICVAGAHGKTSTTALIAYVLQECGEDPTFLVGGVVPQLGTNARVGHGRFVVAEADESDGSLARLRPRAAVVLNAELDHHDHFGSLDDLHALFRSWVAELPREGALVLHESLDYPARPSCGASAPGRARAGARSTSPRTARARASCSRPRPEPLPLRARRAGAHNALNATAALGGARLGRDRARARRGAARRLPRRGAALRAQGRGRRHPPRRRLRAPPTRARRHARAARGEAAPGRLLACFQPHMPWRTRMFGDGFAEALRLADAACVCDVYVARGAADPVSTGELVVRAPFGRTGLPDRLDAELRDAAGWIGAHRARRRPRADAGCGARRRRARTRARAARMSARRRRGGRRAAGAADDDRDGRPRALPGAAGAAAELARCWPGPPPRASRWP